MRRAGLVGCLIVVVGAVLTLAQTPPPAPQTQTPAPATPQPATPGQPTFRTGANLVRVDVTVSGGDDRPIGDLGIDDFEVREDGVVQKIETLQFVRVTGVRAPGDDTSLEIRSPEHAANEAAREDVRLLVLFLDDYHLRYGPLTDVRLRKLLHGFVDAEMKEMDLFAVMDPLTPIDDLNLTRNKQTLFDRIEKLQGRLGGFVPPRSTLEESHLYLNPAERARIRAQITFSALESLVNYLGALSDRRKSVLFVSEGPPIWLQSGSNLSDQLRDVITAANRSNVTINTLDPRELGMTRFASDSNEALALDTGGRRLSNSNDYSRGLRAVLADASAYYLLGYAPQRLLADGKFHNIDVKVKRKGAHVTSRKGYFAPTPEETTPRPPTPTAPADVTNALGRLTPPPVARALDWWLGFERAADTMRATFSWEPLEQAAGSTRGAPQRVVVSVGDAGSPEHVALAATTDAAGRGPWQVTFAAPAGKQKLRVKALAADGGTVDEWSEDIVVPDLNGVEPAIGPLRVYRASTAAAWRAVVAGPGEIAPIATRKLRRTDRVLVTIPLSAGAADAPLSAELLTTQGKKLVTLPVSRGSSGEPRIEIPVANLAQAQYVLRVAADRSGAAPETQALAFSVVP